MAADVARSTDGAPLSIVIGRGGDEGAAVRQVLAAWARSELIRPCYWVAPQGSGEGRVDAWRIDGEGVAEVAIPDHLGGTVWSSCRIALVQPVHHELEDDGELVPFAQSYAAFLCSRVLMHLDTVKVNLIVPTSAAREAPGSVLFDGWDQTVVVAPFGLRSPHHTNTLIDDVADLHRHTALSVASAIGLWAGVDHPPARALGAESADGAANPRLMRTFVRALFGGYVARELAEVVLVPQGGRWRAPDPEGRTHVLATDPAYVVDELVRQAGRIDRGVFTYQSTPALVVPPVTKAGWSAVVAAFKEFVGVLVRRVRDLPARWVASAEKRMTTQLFGADGAYEFEFGLEEVGERTALVVDLREQLARGPRLTTSLEGRRRTAERTLAVLGAREVPPVACPQAWSELRQLCLSTIDGGPLPDWFEPPMAGAAREVVTEPARLVPDPEGGPWVLADEVCDAADALEERRGTSVAPCDPLRAHELRGALASAVPPVSPVPEGAVIEIETEAVETEAEIGAEAEIETEAVETDPVGAAVADLDRWIEPREGSMLWRLGEAIESQLGRASRDHEAAMAAMADGFDLDDAGVERTRKRLLIIALVALAATAALVALGSRSLGLVVGLTSAVVLVALVVLSSFLWYSRARSRAERRYAQALADRINTLNLLVHAAREVSRLSTLYRAYVEWAEIIGWTAHHPWEPADDEVDHAAWAGGGGEGPAGLVVGHSTITGERLVALQARAGRAVQRAGWLGARHHDATDVAMARKARLDGIEIDVLDPDADARATIDGTRHFLLEELRERRPQHVAHAEALLQLDALCAGLPPDELFELVACDGEPPEGVRSYLTSVITDPEDAKPFVAELLVSDAAVRGVAEGLERFTWAPFGGAGEGVRPAGRTGRGAYLAQSVRIDMTRALVPEDLWLFSGQAGSDGGVVRPGDPPPEVWSDEGRW
jgi:hypothetical protein